MTRNGSGTFLDFFLACSAYQHSTFWGSTIYGNRHSGHDLQNTESLLHVSFARRQPAWLDELAWAFDCLSSSSNMRSSSCDKLNAASMSCNGLLYRTLHLTLARICTLFFCRPLVREVGNFHYAKHYLGAMFCKPYMFRLCTTLRQENSI